MEMNSFEKTFLREEYSFDIRNKELYSSYGVPTIENGVATIPIVGPVGTYNKYSRITSVLEDILANDEVNGIIFLIDSPGGAVSSLFDTCHYIEKASKKKKCVAYVTGMACSAAYALAVSCGSVYVREDSEVGSCGCYAHPVEYGEDFYKKEGLIHRIFRSKCSPKKNSSIITNEEEAKAFADEVDKLGEKYLRYVAEKRGVDYDFALSNFGQGGTLVPEMALKAKMIDGVCTLEQLISSEFSSLSGGEGEVVDISAMSSEEKKSTFSALCSADPTLIEESIKIAKEEERKRILSLEELRDGSDAINNLVNAAVEDGRTSTDIALDIVKAMKEEAQKAKAEAEEKKVVTINSFVEDTTDVGAVKTAAEENPFMAAATEMEKEKI